jgi:hypothetical protein
LAAVGWKKVWVDPTFDSWALHLSALDKERGMILCSKFFNL